MIQASRLQELIEQGATIYCIKDNGDGYFVFELYFDNVDLRPGYKIVDKEDGNKHLIFGVNDPIEMANLENIFEAKEDAEFVLRYKRIPKTEYLDLPTFEEFKDKAGGLMFYIKTGCVLLSISDDRKMVYIQGDELIFNALLTKENYLEACELCRKLWLGEKV